jgi:putative membrane-bound dehydrogenase-like protein
VDGLLDGVFPVTLRLGGRGPRSGIPWRAMKLPLAVSVAILALLFSCRPLRKGDSESEGGSGPQIHGEVRAGISGRSGTMTKSDRKSDDPSKDRAQGSGAKDLSANFEVPAGLAVTLFAESPQLYNPTAMDVDVRGRVWVTEGVNYRQWNGRNPGLHHPEGDRVVILEDTDGDGACDSSKVFVQDKDLVSPLGIAVIGDPKNPKVKKVVVSCSPSIFVYTDEDGDDKADKKEVFLTGFGGHDHDHGVHSVVVGPDGRWYFAVGNAGPHIVKDKSGWTLRSGSIYRGGGEFEADNHPGLVSDDGRVWTGGLILRCEPDGTKLTVMAHNFRNEYEVALDSFGNMFTEDNDDDGSQGCRTAWVMEGGNYGYFSADGSREWQADRRPGQDVWAAHWHQDDPGVCPAGTRNGAGGPTGVCVYEGDLVPQMTGKVLDADAGANCVYAHTPVAKGAGIDLAPGKLIAAKPKEGDEKWRWFRPSDVCVSTDGSILVADWWDPGVGGHQAGDREAYGRILRIAPIGARYSPLHLDVTTLDGQAKALGSPAVNVRALGSTALGRQDPGAFGELCGLCDAKNPRLRARALWLLARTPAGQSFIKSKLSMLDSDGTVAVFRALEQANADLTQWSQLFSPYSHPSAVERELAISLRDQGWELSQERVTRLAQGYIRADRAARRGSIAHDRWSIEAIGIAAQGKEQKLYDVLASENETDPSKWSERFADIAWRLHPPGSLAALTATGRSKTLAPEDRRQAVEAIAFIRDRKAGEAMLDLALGGPEDVRPLAAWWVEHNDTADWREYHLAAQLPKSGREGATLRWTSGILTQGSVDVDVDIAGGRTLWLVVTSGKLGNGCDWSDWIEPRLTGPNGDLRLVDLSWRSATAEWGNVNKGKNANAGPLAIGGTPYDEGIGTHAVSEIAFDLPKGCSRFHALAGLDDGGTLQKGCHSDVEFQVWVASPPDPVALEAMAKPLVTADAKPEDVESAAKALGAQREGGLLLLRLAGNKKLTPRAVEAAGRSIRDNPDLSVRALALERFPVASPASAPRAEKALKLAGSAGRGARVFFGDAAKCSVCHAYHGRGGDIGPDLTTIGAKYGKPQMLDAILNPSKAIANGYEAWLVETKDGLLESGFLLSDGDAVVLKDTSGKRHVIPASEIETRTQQKVSTMPDDIALGLSTQDLADILEFLRSNPRAPGTRLEKRSLFDGKTLTGWTFFLEDPKARMEDVWSVKDGVLHCKGRPIGYLRTTEDFTSFVLTVEWRFDPALGAGNSGVLLRMTGADKVWPRSVEAQLNSGDAGDIWNIDEVPMQIDPARTEGRRTVKLAPSSEKPLGEWNRYVITLDGGELTLEVNGVKQNEAHWVDELPGKILLQSEGAPIEFRKIEIVPIER